MRFVLAICAAHIRQAFPADEEGFFECRDLTIHRLLGQLPIPLRRIQRSRHGENKAECLQSLYRAVNAGLAVETSPGHFATTPGPKVDLSDFGPDQSAERTARAHISNIKEKLHASDRAAAVARGFESGILKA